ncbi:MAG: hypothetical protein KatS3mg057_3166 [Herpetosiphonaceae bacterium]|nr:MAG: hypothetical protein KatS3mg057_3166 [Herpetosiphonaceae bacterium]
MMTLFVVLAILAALIASALLYARPHRSDPVLLPVAIRKRPRRK